MTSSSSTPPKGLPLHQQLLLVAQALQQVQAGQSTTTVLEQTAPAARAGVQALLFQVLRSLGRAQALRAQLAPKAPAGKVDALLCTALALLWDAAQAPYTAFTLVNQTVQAARVGGLERQAGFINACLRRFLREQDALIAATDADAQARYNHPHWWIRKLQEQYPQQWQQILAANNRHAPMALRVQLQKISQADYLALLTQAGIGAHPFGRQGIELHQPLPVQALPGFAQGLVSVQDGAAQLAAPLLLQDWQVPAGASIVDACAAPGGKTAHLLELLPPGQAQVLALEVDAQRSQRIHQTLDRLGLSAQVIVADAAEPTRWLPRPGMQFDAILLDAPCSASGIVRRHPDVRWLRRERDIAQLAAIQARLLDVLWPLLKPGGRMVYCTCSVFHEEGQGQIQAFVARNKTVDWQPSAGHLLPGADAVADNPAGDHDGFFYALLHKKA
ncbi:Ribosomal RNA small subunit methyltransferase B [uncultured Comamonas sp.]|nr:Ribosomal RNA small subunit methyltransferase B [uncultured Comamonas sp.]